MQIPYHAQFVIFLGESYFVPAKKVVMEFQQGKTDFRSTNRSTAPTWPLVRPDHLVANVETSFDALADQLTVISLMIKNRSKLAVVQRLMSNALSRTVRIRDISRTVVPKPHISILVAGGFQSWDIPVQLVGYIQVRPIIRSSPCLGRKNKNWSLSSTWLCKQINFSLSLSWSAL